MPATARAGSWTDSPNSSGYENSAGGRAVASLAQPLLALRVMSPWVAILPQNGGVDAAGRAVADGCSRAAGTDGRPGPDNRPRAARKRGTGRPADGMRIRRRGERVGRECGEPVSGAHP